MATFEFVVGDKNGLTAYSIEETPVIESIVDAIKYILITVDGHGVMTNHKHILGELLRASSTDDINLLLKKHKIDVYVQLKEGVGCNGQCVEENQKDCR